MRNGLYSIHILMLDGVRGRDSGVLILRDGLLIGGGPHFWSIGAYTASEGTWKGHLRTNQHSPFSDPFARPLFAGQEVTSGFSGTFSGDQAEVFGTVLVGTELPGNPEAPRGCLIAARLWTSAQQASHSVWQNDLPRLWICCGQVRDIVVDECRGK
ncbi:hypothetical protein ACVIGA_008375 [Bradyrhizobium sp. USDA 3240]